MAESPEGQFEASLAAAEAGDPYEMVKLAIYYTNGEGGAKDLDSANYWLDKAQHSDDPYLLCLLGEYFEFGVVFKKDVDRAVELYSRARDISRVFSYMLGRHYHLLAESGEGIYFNTALQYYYEAAKLFHVPSLSGIYSIFRANHADSFWRVTAIIVRPFFFVLITVMYPFSRNSYRFWKAEDFSKTLQLRRNIQMKKKA